MFILRNISEILRGSKYDVFDGWLEYHSSHSVESVSHVELTTQDLVPQHFKFQSRFNHGFFEGDELLALMTRDETGHPTKDDVTEACDLLLNPSKDWHKVIVELVKYFQTEGWGGVRLDIHLLAHHSAVLSFLTKLGAQRLPNADVYEVVVPFYKYNVPTPGLACKIKIEGCNEVEMSAFLTTTTETYGRTGKRYNVNRLYFQTPLLYKKNPDDQLFELLLNGKHYTGEDSSDFAPRRINKLFGHRVNIDYYKWVLLYYIDVPVSPERADPFHPVAHTFSRFLSTFSAPLKKFQLRPIVFVASSSLIPSEIISSMGISTLWPESMTSVTPTKAPFIPKTVRRNPPKIVKDQTWAAWIGNEIGEILCPCCQFNKIRMNSFHAGHIVSDKDEGKAVVENLIPICPTCNSSMGATNMFEFCQTHWKRDPITPKKPAAEETPLGGCGDSGSRVSV